MSDKVQAFTVVLAQDYSSEDAETIRNAILMIKGVAKVTPDVVDPDTYVARNRLRIEFRETLLGLLDLE